MAESRFGPSVSQGFNFEKDKQEVVGHINSLKIGDTALDSDFDVTDPEDVSKKVKVFSVMSGLYWEGGYNDAVETKSNVSNDNRKKLATLVHSTMSNTEVEIEFTIYKYDPTAKKYYKAFHTNGAKLKGLVEKRGGSLRMSVEEEQSYEVVSPLNFDFDLSVMPQDIEQEIHLAVSMTDKFPKRWGTNQG